MGEEIFKKASSSIKETKVKAIEQTLTLINGAFALVAALAWNEAIKALIDRYFQSGSGLYSKFTYALLITVLVVVVTTRLTKYKEKIENEADKNKPQN